MLTAQMGRAMAQASQTEGETLNRVRLDLVPLPRRPIEDICSKGTFKGGRAPGESHAATAVPHPTLVLDELQQPDHLEESKGSIDRQRYNKNDVFKTGLDIALAPWSQ